jgi:hypothetical protein
MKSREPLEQFGGSFAFGTRVHTVSMRPLAATAICAVLLSLTASRAADETFPLGLEKLHWDMPQAQVSTLFTLREDTFRSPGSPLQHGETRLKSDTYAWQSCHFEGVWRFFKSGLHAITLMDAQGSPACAGAIMDALRARYGEGGLTTDQHGMNTYEWKTAATNVKFMPSVGFGSYVWFYRPSDEAAAAKP